MVHRSTRKNPEGISGVGDAASSNREQVDNGWGSRCYGATRQELI